jgi:hypothetical protein
VEGGALLIVAVAKGRLGEKTSGNLHYAFAGEANAHIRLSAFAEEADKDREIQYHPATRPR